ncbi:hypothetical protein [Orenia marismortui]|uniref:hypothetical protein n=1 Tax=Orenia marismortui TaxID=46469 RepID=UPI000360E5C1|nr:hypothetical protein [Orenia marismortui]
MKNLKVIMSTLLFLVILTNGSVFAMYQAEVNPGEKSLCYSVQSLKGSIKSLTLESDFSLTDNLGLIGVYSFSDNYDFINLDLKLNMVDESDYNISFLGGYYFPLEDDQDSNAKLGILASTAVFKRLDLNGGLNVLLGKEEDYLGFEFGFDYRVTRHWYLEGGFRRFAGDKDNEGLSIGIRNYF